MSFRRASATAWSRSARGPSAAPARPARQAATLCDAHAGQEGRGRHQEAHQGVGKAHRQLPGPLHPEEVLVAPCCLGHKLPARQSAGSLGPPPRASLEPASVRLEALAPIWRAHCGLPASAARACKPARRCRPAALGGPPAGVWGQTSISSQGGQVQGVAGPADRGGGACRTSAREELRLQVGTLRFDLNTLSSKLDKAKRKEVDTLKKTFLREVRPALSRAGDAGLGRRAVAWLASPASVCRPGICGEGTQLPVAPTLHSPAPPPAPDQGFPRPADPRRLTTWTLPSARRTRARPASRWWPSRAAWTRSCRLSCKVPSCECWQQCWRITRRLPSCSCSHGHGVSAASLWEVRAGTATPLSGTPAPQQATPTLAAVTHPLFWPSMLQCLQ